MHHLLIIEGILLVVALLLPLCAYLFLRRMRTIQREEIEARQHRQYLQVLEGMDPESREEILRSEVDTDSTPKPD
jgi:hypothetical protein